MNADYIAGFFDGEGNINCRISKKNKNLKNYQFRIYQAGEQGKEILIEIQKFLGYGNLYKKQHLNIKHKIVWELVIASKPEMKKFKDLIMNLCIIKKEKFPSDDDLKDKRR
jgi:hypothetical protein